MRCEFLHRRSLDDQYATLERVASGSPERADEPRGQSNEKRQKRYGRHGIHGLVACDHEEVAFFTIGRRFSIHPYAKPIRLAASAPFNAGTLLLEFVEICAQLLALLAQDCYLSRGRQRPARNADWK